LIYKIIYKIHYGRNSRSTIVNDDETGTHNKSQGSQKLLG